MTSMMFTSLLLSLSISLINMTSPLTMAAWIMLAALFSALASSIMFYSWAGLMIILIYIGGMLVMFAYFLAITPNQELKMTAPLMFMFIFTTSFMFISHKTPTLTHTLMNAHWITALISPSLILLTITLALILFLALLMVVKVCSSFMGPLRPYL